MDLNAPPTCAPPALFFNGPIAIAEPRFGDLWIDADKQIWWGKTKLQDLNKDELIVVITQLVNQMITKGNR